MSSIFNIFVVSPDTRSERRIDPHWTVSQLKDKLEVITGIPSSAQRIYLLESETDPTVIAQLSDSSKLVGYYVQRSWQVLKVEDTNPSASFTGQLTDLSGVVKFELSDEDYQKRDDSVLAFKKRLGIDRVIKDDPILEDLPPEVHTSDFPIGARCEVESLEPGLKKRGTVRFVGGTKFGKNIWVGIEYDEPFGKNDGSVEGVRYFECRQNYGVFVRPIKVKVGDFPVEKIDSDEEM